MQAVADRLIIIPEKAPDNIGGVFKPEASIEKPMSGIVISAGLDCKQIRAGNKILFLKGHGLPFDDGGEKLVIREVDVLGIFDSAPALFSADAKEENTLIINKLPHETWERVFCVLLSETVNPYEKTSII